MPVQLNPTPEAPVKRGLRATTAPLTFHTALITLVKVICLAFVAVFAVGVWLVVGSYVAEYLPANNASETTLKWVISGSVGSLAAAVVASPFLVVLFDRRRWPAALFAVAPLFVMNGLSSFSIVGAYLVGLYFILLLAGAWLTKRVLSSV